MYAQVGRVFIKSDFDNNAKPIIMLKWYSKEIICKDGVNIYRKEASETNWKKLNDYPIKMSTEKPEIVFKDEPRTRAFAQIAQENDVSTLPGMLLLNIITKSCESNKYAEFLGLFYSDSDVENGKSYSYQVKKIALGNEFLLATSATVVAGIKTEFDAPKEIKIKADTLKAKITWKNEPNIYIGVDIFRFEEKTLNGFQKLNKTMVMAATQPARDTANNYHYIDDTLKENTKYTYKLIGKDMFGGNTKESAPIEVLIKDLIPPAPPIRVKRRIKNPIVTVSWRNAGDFSIIGYNIYRSMISDGVYVKLNPQPLGNMDTSFVDSKILKSGPYYYKVSSLDASGNESFSEKTFAEIHDITSPAKPTNVVCKPDTGFITISWKANTEPDLMGYMLYRTSVKNDKDFFVLINADPMKDNFYKEQLPKNAKSKFLYKVIAIDSSYNRSPYSEVASARMPDIFPPAAPHFKSLTVTKDGLKIDWVANADPDLKHYLLYKKIDDKSKSPELLSKNPIPKTEKSFIDKNCEAGKKYKYYMIAQDSAMNSSYTSDTLVGMMPIKDQLAEFNEKYIKFKYTIESKKVEIDWKIPNELEYLGVVIYKSENDDKSFLPYTDMLTVTKHIDTVLKRGKNYAYKLKLFLKNGAIYISKPYTITVE